MTDKPVPEPTKGQLEAITYADKIIAVKRRCSCGGDVDIKNNPDGPGKVATCRSCGATVKFGGS